MQERHTNRKLYFEEQAITTARYVIPFVQELKAIDAHTSVLEVGCGEGGNLLPFFQRGCKRVVGIDLSEGKIENANKFYEALGDRDRIEFIRENIYNVTPENIGQFDIIIARDVLEHIHDQQQFMGFIRRFIRPGGTFFLAFPPWHNPFGGHQQICESRFLSRLPYFHILPRFMYQFILRVFGESHAKIQGLLEIKQTAITIERFHRILKREGYRIERRASYFINPNYEVKFGLKPRRAWALVSSMPLLRNFVITTNYYLLSAEAC